MYLGTVSETDYIVQDKGEKVCQQGSTILDKSECKIACDQLNVKTGTLRTGKPCYVAGNGKCRQGAGLGPKASLICKNSGYLYYYWLNVIIALFDWSQYLVIFSLELTHNPIF